MIISLKYAQPGHDQLLPFSCCIVRVAMMAISLHLLLWVGIVKVWPGFLSWDALLLRPKIRTGLMASAKSRPTASRKKGRLLCGVKRLLEIRGMASQRFFKQRKIQTRLLAASERCDQHFSSAILHFETDSGAFYSPETVPHQHLSKIHQCTDVEF